MGRARLPCLAALLLLAGACLAQDQEAYGADTTGDAGGAYEDEEDCQCVQYFLCSADNTVNTNGAGIIDPRSSVPRAPRCPGEIEVCCKLPSEDTSVTSAPPSGPEYTEAPPPPPSPPTPTHGQDYTEPQQPQPTPDYNGSPNERVETNVVVPMQGCGVKRQQATLLRILTPDGADDDTATFFAEFPWMLAVLVEERIADGRPLNRFKCGASLIAPGVALTAAHCISGQEPSALKVRAGEWDTQKRSEPLPHQDRGVTRVVLHPHYREGPLYNDVALIFLDAPFDLTDNVDIVCLPSANQVFYGDRCYATGWGRNAFEGGAYQKILRKVDLPMVPNPDCQNRLRQTRLGAFFKLHSSFVCAGGEAGRDTCQGDGGGPLVCPIPGDPGRFVQVGITAWGIGCGEGTPAVYASVAHARPWISSVLDQQQQQQQQ